MSKELEIMKEERERLVQEDYDDSLIEECDLVIKALQHLESIDNANPSEALETLKDMLIGNGVNDNINDYVDNLILPIKQALLKAQEEHKALEIINEKNVNIGLLKLSTNLIEYHTMVHAKTGENTELTEEEVATVKEVLKWRK